MHVKRLNLYNFRNYTDLSMKPVPGLNILVGKNAQGKTSLLEAVYLLATARSWKSNKDSVLVNWSADRSSVSAEIARQQQNDIEIEVALSRAEKKQVRVNTIRQLRLADFLGRINVVLIEPQDAAIIAGEPSERRRFLNLEISQIQPQYCHLLVNYRKVVEHRNRLLKDLRLRARSGEVLDVWNEQLVGYGSKIVERRLAFVERIADLAGVIHGQLTDGGEALEVKYLSAVELDGCRAADEIAGKFRNHLAELQEEEMERRMTLIGPHRDDLALLINGVDGRVYGSHGQQRTTALSLRLAELELMEETAGEPPVVLLDDVMTDLDEERRGHVFQMTSGRCQTFATTSSLRFFDREFVDQGKVFLVSGGWVIEE